ncbi:pseudouridylate synthase RPUSD2-like isoform X2 [Neocloeon triangulifer]|uniref:pseudouridylate synthase RPUSD2-like isoform X2 n=1 Tax=Neocloeon triangulifer TaxID=2078957 RepID=UPI00286EFD78|nr:pseudouridylate synthase RPUSD2-like isoform X2 [Neocloeon triangulifer]
MFLRLFASIVVQSPLQTYFILKAGRTFPKNFEILSRNMSEVDQSIAGKKDCTLASAVEDVVVPKRPKLESPSPQPDGVEVEDTGVASQCTIEGNIEPDDATILISFKFPTRESDGDRDDEEHASLKEQGGVALVAAGSPGSAEGSPGLASPACEKRKAEEDTSSDLKKAKLETKALKAKRPGFTDDRYNETSYYIENGLRKVYPYYFTFTTFTKGRWVGEKILDVFAREFRAHPAEEYERCIKAGTLTVNYDAVDIDYRLKHNDLLANIVHRHETPILAKRIQLVHVDEELVALDKPCSLPVHPCGRYRHNTVVFILAKEYNLRNLRTIHRLDRLTSGLLLFGRSPRKARQMEQQIRNRQVQKEYVCRVEGNFPDEEICCAEPIEVVSYKIGVCKVSPKGKDCSTTFQKLNFNGRTSVVLCKPHTGRMHQIRVHLQYLGYPVVNDPLYNHTVFGPEKGKGGNIGKTDDDLIRDLINIHNAENWLGMDGDSDLMMSPALALPIPSAESSDSQESPSPGDSSSDEASHSKVTVATQTGHESPDMRFDAAKMSRDPHCYECKVRYRDPKPKDLVMYLHAWKYRGPGWEYETQLPEWARDDWEEPLE